MTTNEKIEKLSEELKDARQNRMDAIDSANWLRVRGWEGRDTAPLADAVDKAREALDAEYDRVPLRRSQKETLEETLEELPEVPPKYPVCQEAKS